MANDHLFATVKSFRVFSCRIPNKELFFLNFCCLEQALIIIHSIKTLLFFSFSIQNDFSHSDCMSSNETSLLERTTAPHDGLPMASHRPQREGMLSEVSFEEHFKVGVFLNAKLCLEVQKSCICLAVHLNEKLQ